MANEDNDHRDVSVRISRDFEAELLEIYEVTKASDALRMAAYDGLRSRQERITKDDIADAVAEGMQRAGL